MQFLFYHLFDHHRNETSQLICILLYTCNVYLFIYIDLVFSGTLSRGYTVSSSDRSLSSTSGRDYDGLKQQCDKAMHELQMLRRYVCKSSWQVYTRIN